jgi:TatA/E family protein of Tat protein translocase
MFGTLGFSELIIILVIILIIFGAGRLPQIGEGIGKALKGFKKEVHDVPPAEGTDEVVNTPDPQTPSAAQSPATSQPAAQPGPTAAAAERPAPSPHVPGPEMTPGTTASVLVSGLAPQAYQPPKPKTAQPGAIAPAAATGPHVPTMEQRLAQPPPQPRGVYPPIPPVAQPKPVPKRPSAVVNKDAVARVQAQQAALRAKAATPMSSGQDMQGLGEALGDALRTFRQAAADVRNSVDPQMRTIQAEMEAAQKELEQSIEAAKQVPAVQEEPPTQS